MFAICQPRNELRHTGWADRSRCLTACRAANNRQDDDPWKEHEIKKKCWCTDEFECRVKIPQSRLCENTFGCGTECGSWNDAATDVPIIVNNVQVGTRYPRFEGRAFDAACREEALLKLGRAKTKHEQGVKKTKIVGGSFSKSFNGLMAYSLSGRRALQDRRRRGLQAFHSSVSKVNVPEFVATSGGGM